MLDRMAGAGQGFLPQADVAIEISHSGEGR